MRNVRAAIVLHMFFALQEKGSFTEKETMEELDISRSTFFRALSDFRCYLMEHRSWESLEFDSEKNNYYLVKH